MLLRQTAFLCIGLASIFLLSACSLIPVNTHYELTVVTKNPALGKVYLSESSTGINQLELKPFYAKAWFKPVEISLSAVESGLERSRFKSFQVGYTKHTSPRVAFTVSSDIYQVTANFDWERNDRALWVRPDTILYVSDKDGGESVYRFNPLNYTTTRVTPAALTPSEHAAAQITIEALRSDNKVIISGYPDAPAYSTMIYSIDENSLTSLEGDADAAKFHLWPRRMSPSGNKLYLFWNESNSPWLKAILKNPAGTVLFEKQWNSPYLILRGRPQSGTLFLELYKTISSGIISYQHWAINLESATALVAYTNQDEVWISPPRYSGPISKDGSRKLILLQTVVNDANAPGGVRTVSCNLSIIHANGGITHIGGINTSYDLSDEGLRWSTNGQYIIGNRASNGLATMITADAVGNYVAYDPALDPGADSENETRVYQTYSYAPGYPDLATSNEPNGNRSVESLLNGGPYDLYLVDGNLVQRFTGPNPELAP